MFGFEEIGNRQQVSKELLLLPRILGFMMLYCAAHFSDTSWASCIRIDAPAFFDGKDKMILGDNIGLGCSWHWRH